MSGKNRLSVGIVGAGILGRLIALKGEQLGWKVTLFDKGDARGAESCSFRPPAMLAPISELDVSEPIIAELGVASLKLWPEILRATGEKVFFQQAGSLIVAHPHDRGELTRFKNTLNAKAGADSFHTAANEDLKTLEPQLDRCFTEAVFIPGEGQVDSRAALLALAKTLQQRGIACHFNCEAFVFDANKIIIDGTNHHFDFVVDARGYGAKDELPELRAVRGEIIRIAAPDVRLNRPIRLLHPRYPLYVVPHENGEYVIGATSIESEDDSPMSVRSALELLSAAFALNAGFGEARITEMNVGLRPAFPDNLPRIMAEDGLIRVNGLYRHGYLISPKLAEIACAYIATQQIDPDFASLFQQPLAKAA